MKRFSQAVAIGCIFLISSCSTSEINSRWTTKDLQAKKYSKILVLGILNNGENRLREQIEKHIAGDLKEIGYSAITAYEEYGPKELDPSDEKMILKKITESGVDAVVTIVLLDKKKERYYVPGKVQYTPYSIYGNRFPSYYQTLSSRVSTEGYYAVETRYFWECNFYRASDKELLYSTQTTSFEASTAEALAHQYGRTLVIDMVKHNVLVKPDESALFEKHF